MRFIYLLPSLTLFLASASCSIQLTTPVAHTQYVANTPPVSGTLVGKLQSSDYTINSCALIFHGNDSSVTLNDLLEKNTKKRFYIHVLNRPCHFTDSIHEEYGTYPTELHSIVATFGLKQINPSPIYGGVRYRIYSPSKKKIGLLNVESKASIYVCTHVAPYGNFASACNIELQSSIITRIQYND